MGTSRILIPVFLFSFADDFGTTGLLSSVYSIVFFVSLPLVGEIIDRISLKTAFIIGLSIYFLIGGFYFFAAVSGSMLFIIFARAFNGVSYALDNTARETAFLRYGASIGRTFSYFDSVSSLWRLLAAGILFIIAPFVDIKWLFLAIVVFNFFAFLITLKLPRMKEKIRTPFPGIKRIVKDIFSFSSLAYFNRSEKFPVLLVTILRRFVISLPTSYLAIFSFVSSVDLRHAVLIGSLGFLPFIFSVYFGRFTDRHPRGATIWGMTLLIISFILFSFIGSFAGQLIISFIAGIAVEILYLASMVLVKKTVEQEHLGLIDSTIGSVGALAQIVGLITIGFLIDLLSFKTLGLFMAGLLLLGMIAIVLWWFFVAKRGLSQYL